MRTDLDCIPDIERLKRLVNIGDYPRTQTQIVYCPDCDFQMAPMYFGPSRCPDCGTHMMVSSLTDELRALANGN